VLAVVAACLSALIGCIGSEGRPSENAGAIHVEIADMHFSVSQMSATAGRPFEIIVDNREQGIPHNLSIYVDDSAKQPIAIGAISVGPAVDVVEVPSLRRGTYFFRCDVHRLQMTGVVEVGP
jgi:plastocyanin